MEKSLDIMQGPLPIPTATYRLQLNQSFTFRDAAALIPYLSDLGVSHCYLSPYLRARPGSMHGYDIIDHNTLNPEIGSPEDYEMFVGELHRHGMGQILDIVPNHMGVMGSDNAWWLDVLENGNIFVVILISYLVFEIGNTMFSSRKDMEGALELFGTIIVILIILFFLGLRLPAFNPNIIFDQPLVQEVFRRGCLFLLVPLAIDSVVILLFRPTHRR